MDTATVATHSATHALPAPAAPAATSAPASTDCPLMDDACMAEFQESRQVAASLSLRMRTFLHGRSQDEQAAWIRTSMSVSRELFQPWSMELLYLTGVLGKARFSELERLLGISSRTLSNKLKGLTQAGFLDRHVLDETPVRIEYALSKHGRATAALAAPLFAHLNLHATSQ